ncbi:CDP-glucose 4,6-dehydratase [Akkermansiaceae bacterium]|nr:CDP-glucose 4,6-dehydratase [Akkermansiaceae bacterium]
MFENFYRGRRVLVTGHTGFKGSWLCEWLLSLGAKVAGYALDPEPHEVLYDQLDLGGKLAADHRGNLSERERLVDVVVDFKPEVVLHLAAQPLVRLSYNCPVETFATNALGTAHLLDAVRISNHRCAVVAVTTDKCYENQEWLHSYREVDPMGGHDPYSASKGAAEIIIKSYRRSFFSPSGRVQLVSARAGNVIGGGDWAIDRIVPDCIRAIREGIAIPVRNKIATRPWQHVLEPLSGYLWLGAILGNPESILGAQRQDICSSFNFGPVLQSNRTVLELVQELLKHTDGDWTDISDPEAPHEASKLNLATDKAFHLLHWQPVWSFEETLEKTASWYLADQEGQSDMSQYTCQQIAEYEAKAQSESLLWSTLQGASITN